MTSPHGVLRINAARVEISSPKDAYCVLWIPPNILSKPLQSKTAAKGTTPCFEFTDPVVLQAALPPDAVMEVTIKDRRLVGSDELLGHLRVPIACLARGDRGVSFDGTLEDGSMKGSAFSINMEWLAPPANSSVGGTLAGYAQGTSAAGALYKTAGGVAEAIRGARTKPLPPCEGQTFIVRITVHKARNLQSTDAETRYDPLCEISVMKQRRETDYTKKTNNPVWEEEIFLSFEKVPAGFWSESFSVTVFDHRIGLPNEVIGLAAIDLGAIYNSTPSHQLVQKWLPIVKSATNGLVMGYVKLSVTVLNAKTDPVPEKDEGADDDDDDDIISNLVDLPGARFDEIGLVAHIVEAEGLPAMDETLLSDAVDALNHTVTRITSLVGVARTNARTSDLCDPYVKIVQGNSVVTTPPIQKTYTPKWDCVRSLHMLIPSMSPYVFISAWDQDFGSSDDLIGTLKVDTRLAMRTQIDGPDTPHLPMMWYNLYGSHTNDSSKFCLKQAKGEIVGSAFRGRVLMGITGVPKDMIETQMALSAVEVTPMATVEVVVNVRILLCSMVDDGTFFFEISAGNSERGCVKRLEKISSSSMNSRSKERNEMHFLPGVGSPANGHAEFTASFRVALPSAQELLRKKEANNFTDDPHALELDVTQIPDIVIHLFKDVKVLGPHLYAFHRIAVKDLLFSDGGKVSCVQMHPNCDEETVAEGEIVRSALLHFYAGVKINPVPGVVTLPPNANTRFSPPRGVNTPDRSAAESAGTRLQLRGYFYQARFLPAGDDNGLSDPYVKLIYSTGWMKSNYILETLSPVFNETLVVDTSAEMRPPHPDIIVELWDWDQIGRDTFLGRASIPYHNALAPERFRKYTWYDLFDNKGKPLTRLVGDKTVPAQVLVAFEVVSETQPLAPTATVPRKGGVLRGPTREIITIPAEMAVPTRPYTLDMFIIGLRSMKKLEFLELQCPTVEFEIAGFTSHVPRPAIEAPNANYMFPLVMKVDLAVEASWIPPLSVQVFDHRLGRKVLVGSAYLDVTAQEFDPQHQHELESTTNEWRKTKMDSMTTAKRTAFMVQRENKMEKKMTLKSVAKIAEAGLEITAAAIEGTTNQVTPPKAPKKTSEEKAEKKKQNSAAMSNKQPTTVQSLLTAKFGAVLGKASKESKALDIPDIDNSEYVAGTTNVEELPWFDRFDPPASLRGCNVEHIVTRIHKHATHVPDPQIAHMEHTCEALFGPFHDGATTFPVRRGQGSKDVVSGTVKMAMMLSASGEAAPAPRKISFQPAQFLLRVYILTCSDLAAKDDSVLGSASDPYIKLTMGSGKGAKPTKVITDKENKKMSTLDPDFWLVYEMQGSLPRDSSLLLEVYDWDAIGFDELIGKTEISLEDRWYSTFGYSNNGIPTGGKYTEKRDLFDEKGAKQGRIEMWIDMFPLNSVIPACLSITPPPPISMELRLVIWNTRDVILQDTSIHGEAMTDIYVRSWIKGLEPMAQETDVHYRSLNGEGNFNWRMLFPFVFYTRNKKISALKNDKKSFSLFRVRQDVKPLKPLVYLQIYDDDLLPGTDDFIGETIVNLTNVQPTLTRRTQSSFVQGMISDAFFICQMWPFSLCFDTCKKSEAGGALSLEDRQELAKIEAMKERNARNESLEKQARMQLRKTGKEYDALPEAERLAYLKSLKFKSRLNIFADFDSQIKAASEKAGTGEVQTAIYESPRFWFACTAANGGNRVGDVQVSFELVRLKEDGSVEDKKNEAGKGRSEPNKLPEPKRPDSSFFWLSSPFKAATQIGWKNYKWYIIFLLYLIISAVGVYLFVTKGVEVKAIKFFTDGSNPF